MEVVIRHPDKVKKLAHLFHHLKNIINDININFTNDQMYIQGMDASHACLIEVQIKQDWFDEYNLNENQVVGLNCELLFKIIGCLQDGQEIYMAVEDGGDYLQIELKGEHTISKAFEIALIDIECDLISIPDKEYEADIEMSSEKFRELMQQLSIFSEAVTFKCHEEGIDLIAKGDMGQMTAQIKEEDINEYAIEEERDLSLSYGLHYIEKICAFSKLSKNVNIHCSQNDPMKINYSLEDNEANNESEDGEEVEPQPVDNFIRFFLAPKIDD